MAILVEEEKDRSNIANSLGWFVMGGIIIVAVYYLVFASSEPAVIAPPPTLANITAIGSVSFDPSGVVNGPAFQALKIYLPEPTSTGPNPVGRPNPFISP